MSVHRADGSGFKDEALHPPIRGASCTGRARARRLDGLSFFGLAQRPGPRNSASAETTPGRITPTNRAFLTVTTANHTAEDDFFRFTTIQTLPGFQQARARLVDLRLP